MTAIINATLVMRDHLIPEAALLIEDGKIHAFGEMRNFPIPEGCEIIDAEGQFVGPGLIDIHNHAGNGHWFYDEPIEAAFFGCGGVAEIPNLQDKLIKLAKGGFKHHTTVGMGHMKAILEEAFGTYLGYEIIDIDG